MRDIRMIRKGLRCIAGTDDANSCDDCPYLDMNEECDVQIARDVLELIGDGNDPE